MTKQDQAIASTEPAPAPQKKVSLALQGGGSHGAFTWGVLDALLADGRLDIEAITGTSAGAMNAVAFADGFAQGGAVGARKKLETFWRAISDTGVLTPVQQDVLSPFLGALKQQNSPMHWWGDFLTHYASPYEFNPLNINPLKLQLETLIDFDKVRACEDLKVFIAATNVHNGKIKVFERGELTTQHVLASACLPLLFQAVEIDGVPYWDGGYMGNPALFPLFYKTAASDVILIQINPIERKETPKTARDIQNRLNEISFNGALMGELRAVATINKLIEQGHLSTDHYKYQMLHRIDADAELLKFGAASKMDASWELISKLHGIGVKAGQDWLNANFDAIGVRGTLNLREAFA